MLKGHSSKIYNIVFSLDSKLLALVSHDKIVKL
jgi:hypothetical protein